MTIMQEILQGVSNGQHFHVDFENRNLKLGKHYLIKEGVVANGKSIGIAPNQSTDEVLEIVQQLYIDYKYSYPSAQNQQRRRRYFKCLSADEMTQSQLIQGDDRNLAQAKLETYVLLSVLNGSLKWTDTMGSWFWRGQDGLIILREWIEKGVN